jgi:Tfp pilus assembly protein PilF
MRDTRTAILMAVLLLLLSGYIFQPQIKAYFDPASPSNVQYQPPLAGVNQVKSMKITKKDGGVYMATIEYFYRGDVDTAFIRVGPGDEKSQNLGGHIASEIAQKGTHTIEMEVPRPFNDLSDMVTRKVVAELWSNGVVMEALQVDYVIEWPDMYTYSTQRELAKKSTKDIYTESVAQIDSGDQDSLKAAKKSLELILLRDPKYVAAYPELARVMMKTNWGPEGLRQAENYLLSGLAIDPQNANVKVLLGYVYAHQKRYKEAEEKFVEAATTGTKNLWLWTNWGELLSMQNKPDQALDKYMQAIDAGRTYDTYDRARIFAYNKVFEILENKKQLDKLDKLYKKKVEEFDNYSYFFAEYGRFRLTHFGDYESAISYAKAALEKGCECEEAKYTLGMSYYIAWTRLEGDAKEIAFNQAGVFLPEGPRMLYELARFDATSAVIPQLLKRGASLRTQDNQKYNAMAYALMGNDVEAAQRLSKYGAKFDEPVGMEQYPVGLISFTNENVDAIKMMKNRGVNFAAIKYNGVSAVDYARKLQNKEILDIVENGAKYPL